MIISKKADLWISLIGLNGIMLFFTLLLTRTPAMALHLGITTPLLFSVPDWFFLCVTLQLAACYMAYTHPGHYVGLLVFWFLLTLTFALYDVINDGLVFVQVFHESIALVSALAGTLIAKLTSTNE